MLACFCALFLLTAQAVAMALIGALDPHPHNRGDGHRRVLGRGQIRFDGMGPERWAFRFRREHRRVKVLRSRLAGLHARTLSSASPQPGHLAGWLCIHAREGAWDAQTGNGYYGGLQMTYGWAGRVENAALLSPAAQMAAADAEAAEHGFAYSWMAGQWPRTYPPCAGYFG
jgi:hypothetical protein